MQFSYSFSPKCGWPEGPNEGCLDSLMIYDVQKEGFFFFFFFLIINNFDSLGFFFP